MRTWYDFQGPFRLFEENRSVARMQKNNIKKDKTEKFIEGEQNGPSRDNVQVIHYTNREKKLKHKNKNLKREEHSSEGKDW